MNLNEYQEAAKKTANYDSPEYPFVCLGEEAGEVLGKIAKYMRKHKMSSDSVIMTAAMPQKEHERELRGQIMDELGDVLWEVALCAEEIGVGLEEVGKRNTEKLASRKQRGVIDGSGDDR